MLYVIGIGPGDPDYITDIGRKYIERADIIIGGKRNIQSLEQKTETGDRKKFFITADMEKLKEYIIENRNHDIALIASGDPSIYGIADFINRELEGKTDIEIVPGISSIQYAFSRFRLSMNDVYITSSHGRLPDFKRILSYPKVAMVTDRKTGPAEIAIEVKKSGKKYIMYVGENLSYGNERLTSGSPDDILKRDDYEMSVLILVEETDEKQ